MAKNTKENKDHKYVYHLYTNDKHEIHLEKHTIVYMNSNYVYFKISKKGRLGELYIKRIHDDLYHLDLDRKTRSMYPTPININEYIWSCEGAKELIEKLNQQNTLAIRNYIISRLNHNVEVKKQQYEDAMRELNDFMMYEDSKS